MSFGYIVGDSIVLVELSLINEDKQHTKHTFISSIQSTISILISMWIQYCNRLELERKEQLRIKLIILLDFGLDLILPLIIYLTINVIDETFNLLVDEWGEFLNPDEDWFHHDEYSLWLGWVLFVLAIFGVQVNFADFVRVESTNGLLLFC